MSVLSELEAAIVRDPDDLASYAVLGDWLVEQNDPRGELIATQLAADATNDPELRRAALRVFVKHRDTFIGELGSIIAADSFTWRAGFIQRAVLSYDRLLIEGGALVADSLADVVTKLLSHPSARFLRSLVVRQGDRVAWGRHVSQRDVVDRLADAGPQRALHELQLGDATYGSTNFGRIARAYPSLAMLHRLVLEGEFKLGAVDLPELREVSLRPSRLRRRDAHDIAEAHWPKLRSLRIQFHDYPDHIDRELTAMVHNTRSRELVHLALVAYRGADSVIDSLSRSPMLARLETLDLSHGHVTDRGLRPMLANADAFRHLTRIDLTATQVTPKMLARARVILPAIIGIPSQT